LADEDPDTDGKAFTYNLRFPGQIFDAESGVHYNYYRDFDPSIGRYIQSDPIGLEGGINTYAYVGSRPLTRFDPLGLYDSRMRGSPGNDPYPGCGNDPACRAGFSRPEPPTCMERCFMKYASLGLAKTAAIEGGAAAAGAAGATWVTRGLGAFNAAFPYAIPLGLFAVYVDCKSRCEPSRPSECETTFHGAP
jgi:RHS repeat-associated protein